MDIQCTFNLEYKILPQGARNDTICIQEDIGSTKNVSDRSKRNIRRPRNCDKYLHSERILCLFYENFFVRNFSYYVYVVIMIY